MPVWGTGPRRPDGGTNNPINATPTYGLPSQISGLALWFDAADTSTIRTNISSLNQWWSKTSISTVMSNAFGLPGPTWVSTAQNGLPVVRFRNDNSTFMSSFRTDYPTANFVTNNETTMFLAYNPTNNGAPFGVYDTAIRGAGGIRLHPQCGQSWFFGNIFNSPSNAILSYSYPVNTGFKVETYFGRQSTLAFRNNGALFAASTMLTGLSFPNQNNLVIMGGFGHNACLFTQDIGEAILYNRGLSDAEILNVESYLAAKWNVRTTMPFNHPARIVGPPIAGYRLLTYNPVVSNYAIWYDAMDTNTIGDIRNNFPPLLPPNALGVGRWNDKSGNNRFISNFVTNPSFFNLLGNNFYPNVNSPGFVAGRGYNNLRGPTGTPTTIYNGSSISAFFVLSIQPNAGPNTFFALTSTVNTQNIPTNPDGPNPSTFDFSLNYISNTIGFSRFGGGGEFGTFPRGSNNVLTAPLPNFTSTNLISIHINPTQTTIGSVLPSTNTISINGAFVSSSTRYAGNPFNFIFYSMFGAYNFPANSFSFFNEVGIFFRTLTTPERVAYENQLIRKWGLPSNSPVTPLNANPVTNGLYFNIDAYDPTLVSTSVTSDGLTRVDTVFDKSGNNRNFKFITGFSNIFYNRVSTMNQYNSLYFSTGATTAGILSNMNPVNTFSTNSYSFFLVYNQLSTNNAVRVLAGNNQTGSDASVGGFSYQLLGQSPFFTPIVYQSAGGNITNGCNYVYSLINNGGPTFDIFQTSTFYSYHNIGAGAVLSCNINLASTNLLNISQFNIGGRATTPSFCFNGLISEVILYNRALFNSERLEVENYLINKWGISTLVSNVPVRSGLNLWLDSYDSATVLFSTNTTQVTQWRDKSLCNFHFSNALNNNGIRLPTYTTNPVNSLPGLLFSNNAPGSIATGIYSCNFNYPVTREATIFTVAQWNSGNGSFYSPVFCMLSNNEFVNNTANSFTVVGPASGLNVNLYRSSPGGFLSNIGNTLDRPTLVTGVFNSTFTTIPDIPQNNIAVGRNGVIGSRSISSFISTLGDGLAVRATNFNVNQAVLGLRAPNGGDATWFHAGYIHEILLYNRTLTFSERQQVESYLMTKWNI